LFIGDATYSGRKKSQQLYLDFLDEPADSIRRHRDGIYMSYTYGPYGRQVQIILLDVRYQQTATDILGGTQWLWLEDQLRESRADIVVIASGIQILSDTPFGERWENFGNCRQRLLDLIVYCLLSSLNTVTSLPFD
jgi:alkaline phosphatase D